MKINSELERLLQAEQLRKQQGPATGNSGGVGFEDLFTQQLGQSEQATGANPEALQILADPARLANIGIATMAGLEGVEANQGADEKLIDQLAGGLTSALSSLDKLSASLQSGSSGSLKDAWSALQNMDGEIAGLREGMGQLSKPDAELESMLNELEILSVTEKFKLNRGDYM